MEDELTENIINYHRVFGEEAVRVLVRNVRHRLISIPSFS